ncbi:MAG TPA: type II secretion system F family protein [Syntrophales bacterium]|nr:type II secretion system F family protein [Syntrophales bacterium]
MPIFSYRSTTRDGVVSEGLIEATDEKSVLLQLKNGGVIPLRVEKKKSAYRDKISFVSAKSELQAFSTELFSLLNAGLPLDRSLNILAELAADKKMQDIIYSVLNSIRGGSSFSDALEKHPKVFSALYVNMIRAGESGGALETVLDKLNEFLESAQELKDHIFSALLYPTILVITGIISIIILVTYVVPKFSTIFSDMGDKLPIATKVLLEFSSVMQSVWWIIILMLLFGVIAFRNYIRTETGRYNWDAFKLKIMGDVIVKLETARFCRTLGALLRSGVPLLQAVKNSKDIIGNHVISFRLDKISRGIKEGQGIARPLSDAKIFPQLALSMIKVGEETGQLDTMLLKVANTYEKSLKVSIKRFVSFLEPVLILGMGLLTGFIVISMLMAIFSITDIPF